MVMIKASRSANQISGRLGGNIFSINGGTQLMRSPARKIKSEPSASQKLRRKAWTTLQQRYWKRILTTQFKSEWTVYANNHPIKNRIGDSIRLTGFSMFMRINLPRQLDSLPILLQPIDLRYI